MSERYLVLSDIHGRGWAADRAKELMREHDIEQIVLLGDITHFGPPQFAEELITGLGAKCMVVPGNCDPPGTLPLIERCATSLHGKKVSIGGRTWGGLGGSNPTIFETPFEMPEEEMERLLEPVMEEGMVLVLHCPPKGTWDNTFSGLSVGSTAVRELVERYRPSVVLSGHVHEDRGIVNKDGIWYMNPGAVKDHCAGMMELGDEVRLTLLDI